MIETDAVRCEAASFDDIVLGEGEDRARRRLQDRARTETPFIVPVPIDVARTEQAAVPLDSALEVADAQFDVGDTGDQRRQLSRPHETTRSG